MRDESGYTIIAMLALLLIGIAMVGAALGAAISSNNASGRNARVQRAQQAADAGVQAALYDSSEQDLGTSAYNFNGGPLGLSTWLDCLVPQRNASLQITGVLSVSANSAGVCPIGWSSVTNSATTASQPVGQHSSYQAEMSAGQTNLLNGTSISGQNGSAQRELFPKIVSIGAETSNIPAGSGTIYSREEAILAPIAPLQALEGENSVTIDGGLSALGLGVAALNGDVLSRGDLTLPSTLAGLNLSGGLLATLIYSGTLHGGLSVAHVHQASQSSIISRPAVTISSSKPDCGTSGGTATTCSNALFSCASCYSSATDSFTLTSGSATITSGDYVFCNFSATGGTLNISPTSSAPVRIFIDSPTSTRCASDGLGSNQGNFNDTAGFSNGLLGTGGVLASSGMQVYVAGNGTGGGSTVQIGPTSTSGLLSLSALTYGAVVYAPLSNVTVNVPGLCVLSCSLLSSGGIFEGALVGYNTTVNALTVTQDLDLSNYPLYAGINAFRVTQYIQCDNSVTSLSQAASDTGGC